MQFTKAEHTYILKIEKGEEVIKSLTDFCTREHIENAHFSAIGAVEWISCGYYSLATEQYHFKQYDELCEVLNATGNVMLKDGVPFVHMHATFSDESNQAFGGHIEEMRVGVVLEVMLTVLPTQIARVHDESIGLYLMQCGE